MRVVIACKPRTAPDEALGEALAAALGEQGHEVFLDRRASGGLAWAVELDRRLRVADLVVPLLSATSIASELLAYEVEMAAQASWQQRGRPSFLPVRIQYAGPLPEELDGVLAPYEYAWDAEADAFRARQVRWHGPADDVRVLEAIRGRLVQLAREEPAVTPAGRPPAARHDAPFEAPGGAVPLDSGLYLERPADEECRAALRRGDSLILLKGARQMGKTSLLGRACQHARSVRTRVVLTDFQKLQAADFAGIREFYRALAGLIADQLEADPPSLHQWATARGANAVFEEFWKFEVLERSGGRVLWACDEFDRLLVTPFAGEVCALLRSWHNARVLDPLAPWPVLTVAIAYATEAHLFIPDLQQSPFNVGTRLTLEDFNRDQVEELDRRHGRPLATSGELDRFHALLNGHPHLTRVGLYELRQRPAGLDWLESVAARDDGPFNDHLRRLLVALGRDPALLEVMRGVLRGEPCRDVAAFHRLRSGGVLTGGSAAEARPRCELYARYLKAQLG